MASRALLILMVVVGTACGDDGPPLEPPDGPPAPEIWQPAPGEYGNWDIQLHAPFDLATQRAMYALDLFDVVPSARTVMYDDGPLAIPAGALASAIADLHATTPPTIVVCGVGTGAIRLTDPDAEKFPGFEATPPDNPTAPAAGSVIGWSTSDLAEPGERFLDIREASRSIVMPLIAKRFALAKEIGCDAILARKTLMGGSVFDPGFPVTPDDSLSLHLAVADLAHTPDDDTKVAVGLHNGFVFASDTTVMAAYEFQIMEGLAAARECCDEIRPFLDRGKAAFALDFLSDDPDAPVTVDIACTQYAAGNMKDGLIKDAAQTSAVRETCP